MTIKLIAARDCAYCIDGIRPAGIRPDLGAVLVLCPACCGLCPGCNGTAIFPAEFTCRPCLDSYLTALALIAVFCDYCAGVIAVIDPDDFDPHNPDDGEVPVP